MLLEPAGYKAENAFDTIHNRENETKKKSRNMLVIGMIVSLLLLVICYIALSGDQPKSIDNHIPNKDDPTAPDDHKPKPPPVVEDDKVEPLARMK